MEVFTGDFIGCQKCHNLKKHVLRTVAKVFIFFSPSSLVGGTFRHSNGVLLLFLRQKL